MSRFVTLDHSRFAAQKSKLRSELQRMQGSAEREVAEKSRFAAIFVAQQLAEKTFPSRGAIGFAVRSMAQDVNSVFITASKAYRILDETAGARVAAGFYSAYKKGDWSRAEQILRSSSSPISGIEIGVLRPELHEKARSPRDGRVNIKSPLMIVSSADLEAYLKVAIREIGKTASGWNACAAKLGGSESATRWKSTAIHGSSGGSVRAEKGAWEMTNIRPLARKHISPGQVASILKTGREYLEDLLEL